MDYQKYLLKCPCGSHKSFSNCCKPKNLHNVIQSPKDAENDTRPDWRIAVITQTVADIPEAYPGGPSHKKGAYVALVHEARHPRLGKFGFTTPHATALSLGAAVKSASFATEL